MTISRFLIRLLPPRPSFVQDMTEAERSLMNEHVAYWTRLLGEGVAIAFGPVADPNGPWGLGLIEVESSEAAAAIIAADPVIQANSGFRTELLPLVNSFVRPFTRV